MSEIIDCEMHIGDEVFVHGYIDEIRNDTIIIRNVGGYFGTSRDEVFYYEEDERGYETMNEADRKTEPTISKMEQVDKDINVRSKGETQTDCDGCKHYADEYTADACYECKRSYSDRYEPQTERSE